MSDLAEKFAPTLGTTTALLRPYLEAYASSLPVRRVTVVGNAPLTPSAERVEIIENSDLVIRCNSLMLDRPGDEPTLGTKTNVVVLARVSLPTPFVFHDYRNRAYLVPEVGRPFPVGKPLPPALFASWPHDLGNMPVPNDGLGLPLIQKMKETGDPRPAVPTTGTLAIAIGYHLFPEAETVITGFSFLHDRTQTSWQHHYGPTVPVHPAHLLDREGAILQEWVEEGHARYVP